MKSALPPMLTALISWMAIAADERVVEEAFESRPKLTYEFTF